MGISMQAHDLMTRDPVTVAADTPTPEIARVLLDHAISGVPVVDARGALVGMVSEGDLLGRGEAEREARREWWLALLAEGETLGPDFQASLKNRRLAARDVMSAPAISVTETTEAGEIAQLLQAHRIKRVPVLRDDRVVGIVSRGDLLRALAAEHMARADAAGGSRRPGIFGDIISSIDAHFGHRRESEAFHEPPGAPPENEKAGFTVADFHALEADFQHHNVEQQEDARHAAAEQRQQRIKELIDQHIGDDNWRSLLHHARDAAGRGEKELMLLRFPADLCSDRGRAINAPLPDWPATLRGEAAEIYSRWERDLQPGGFRLTARVLDFPGGFPGDIGLFLLWD
jgi:CBS domain-containing protein